MLNSYNQEHPSKGVPEGANKMPRKSQLVFRDADGQTASSSFPHYPLTIGNLGDFLSQWGNLKTKLAAITRGRQAKENVKLDETELSNLDAASPEARVELKIRFDYVGNNGSKPTYLTVPCPDLSIIQRAGKDDVVLTAPQAMVDAVAAMETIMVYPGTDDETITITGAKLVGRNV